MIEGCNGSCNIERIAMFGAGLKGISVEVVEVAWNNSMRLFRLDAVPSMIS